MNASSSPVSVNLQPPVARISLSNPPINVITFQILDGLKKAIAEVESNPEISVVVIEGQGGTFSAGVSVAVHTPEYVPLMLEKFHAVVRDVIASKKIFIAMVRGHCLGGGAELAMVCDLVYTTKAARWGFPEISLGCFPPVACTALSALNATKRVTELILTGRLISGKEAEEMGLANLVVADYKLRATVQNIAERLGKMSASSLALAKKAMYLWDSMHCDKGLARAEKIYVEELMKTEDAQEGVNAFLQKRKPEWKGK